MSVLSAKKRRRTYLRADARRAQILDVAKHVFARQGYRDANVADICSAARIGRGTLYQYFENKEAVLRALMEDLAARVKRVLTERPEVASLPISASTLAPAQVHAFCAHRLRQLLEAVFVDEETLRLLLREARGNTGPVDDVVALIDALVFDALHADSVAAQQAGVLRRGDARLQARFILGGIEKMCLAALGETTPLDLDVIVEAAVTLELFGLLSEEVRSPPATPTRAVRKKEDRR